MGGRLKVIAVNVSVPPSSLPHIFKIPLCHHRYILTLWVDVHHDNSGQARRGRSSKAQNGCEVSAVEQSKNRERFSFGRKRGLRQDDGASGAAETGRAKSAKGRTDVTGSPARGEGHPLLFQGACPFSCGRLYILREDQASPQGLSRRRRAGKSLRRSPSRSDDKDLRGSHARCRTVDRKIDRRLEEGGGDGLLFV